MSGRHFATKLSSSPDFAGQMCPISRRVLRSNEDIIVCEQSATIFAKSAWNELLPQIENRCPQCNAVVLRLDTPFPAPFPSNNNKAQIPTENVSPLYTLTSNTPSTVQIVVPEINYVGRLLFALVLVGLSAFTAELINNFLILGQINPSNALQQYHIWLGQISQLFQNKNALQKGLYINELLINRITYVIITVIATAYIFFPHILPNRQGYPSLGRRLLRLLGTTYLLFGLFITITNQMVLPAIFKSETMSITELSRIKPDIWANEVQQMVANILIKIVNHECLQAVCQTRAISVSMLVTLLITLGASIIYRKTLVSPRLPISSPQGIRRHVSRLWYHMFTLLLVLTSISGLIAFNQIAPRNLFDTQTLRYSVWISINVIVFSLMLYWPPAHKANYIRNYFWVRILVIVIGSLFTFQGSGSIVESILPIALTKLAYSFLPPVILTTIVPIPILLLWPLQRIFS